MDVVAANFRYRAKNPGDIFMVICSESLVGNMERLFYTYIDAPLIYINAVIWDLEDSYILL